MSGPPPLAGVRVIEVGNFIAAPYCGMQLADLGAAVIKVENPEGGDTMRGAAPFLPGKESSTFVRLNRNKRSLALDLKSPQGKRILRRLAARSDVLLENMRPGTMAELGLDFDTLRADSPGLIYLSISGWGQTGRYSHLAGLDIIAQGMSGLMSITGEPDGNPVKVGVPVTDLVCGLYGALAVMAALRARERDGQGQHLDVSLFESGVALAVWEAGRYFATGEVPQRLGSAHQNNAPYQAIRAADGYFTVGATTPRNWAAFCAVIGRPEWIADERFKDNPSRHARRTELIARIEEITRAQPLAHWVARLQEAGVPADAIQTYDQVFTDPHLADREFFWEAPHSSLGPVRQLGSPMNFSGTQAVRATAGPRLGEHSGAILDELGFSEQEIGGFIEAGVTRGP